MIKLFIGICIILLIISCGNTEYIYVNKPVDIIKEVEVEKEVIKYINQDFENVYYFENGGKLELLVGVDNEITIVRDSQYILSVNPKNQTFASHPSIYKTGLEVFNDSIDFVQNINYTDGNDLEEDESGTDIRGYRRTDFSIKLVDSGIIELTIKVYSSKINNNTNYLVATRILRSL